MDMMGADTDDLGAGGDLPPTVQRDPPRGHIHGLPGGQHGHIVLAAGQPGGGLGAGLAEQLIHGHDGLRNAPVHDADPAAAAPGLAPVVGHPQDRAGELGQGILQFQLQLVFQVAVQGGKGLVQQNGPGTGGQDAGQGGALLLAAGELPGLLTGDLLQPELAEFFLGHSPPPRFIPDGHGDVLADRHVGKQGVLLKQVAHLTLLGRQVNVGGAVVQGLAIQLDDALVGPQNARDAPQCHALAAAGGAQKGQSLVLGCEIGLELEGAQLLADTDGQTHDAAPFLRLCRSRDSSRFTASRKTAEMAMFTKTQRRAPASSLVRHSW